MAMPDNHTLVIIVLVLLVSIAALLLIMFSLKKARKQQREANERGAALRGPQFANFQESDDYRLQTPPPVMKMMEARQYKI